MNNYLKEYHVELTTLGPVHVGNGKQINKKEYIDADKGKVGICDINKLYQFLKSKHIAGEFEKYVLYNYRDDLTKWLRNNGIEYSDVAQCMRYVLECGDAIIDRETKLQVMECIKDSYGNPYIPGSTLKGMFRTIILASDIINNPLKYSTEKSNLQRNIDINKKRQIYLRKQMKAIEDTAFKTLKRNERDPLAAVNDYMQGFIVSDSRPLNTNDLILCQKVEIHTDGNEKRLNLLRECIKPATKICFTISVDSSLCNIDDQKIRNAVNTFAKICNENFLKGFNIKENMIDGNCVYVGGGTGFVSKTIIYPLLGKQIGLNSTIKIFEKTDVPKQHMHYKDKQYGVSPHILKCTKYNGRLYQMGLCRVEIQ